MLNQTIRIRANGFSVFRITIARTHTHTYTRHICFSLPFAHSLTNLLMILFTRFALDGRNIRNKQKSIDKCVVLLYKSFGREFSGTCSSQMELLDRIIRHPLGKCLFYIERDVLYYYG